MRSALFVLAVCASCAGPAVDPTSDHERAREAIRSATGQADVYDPAASRDSQAELDAALAGGLTLDEALRLALLENRLLQAGFARLGVARAELAQAGLMSNPRLALALAAPTEGGRPRIEVELLATLSDLWQLPARERKAEAALERELIELSRLAGELVFDVRRAYVECVAADERAEVARENAEIARAMQSALEQRRELGAATQLDVTLAASERANAELASLRAEGARVRTRRELAVLLSSERDLSALELEPFVDPRGAPTLDRDALVARGLAARLDVRAATKLVASAEASIALERRRARPAIDAGVVAERTEGGASSDWLIGPALSLELPLFDRNQAGVARAEAQRDLAARELEDVRARVAQEIRADADRVLESELARELIRSDLAPRARAALELAREARELGSATSLAWLEARRTAARTRLAEIDARTDVALARLALERSLGERAD